MSTLPVQRESRRFVAFFHVLAICLVVFSLGIAPAARAADEGSITGRVLNPSTGEYLRNASVRLQETGLSVTTEDGGVYRFSPVSPGAYTVEVSYTGFHSAIATVQVAARQTVQKNFELISSLQKSTSNDGTPIKLEQFVVISDVREGSAKAIMDQRSSMNITNTVASDTFGDVAEGNVGEFLKHMPGVALNLVSGEVRTVSLRGLGAEYTAVTLNGLSLASADANTGAAGDARAFGFEQVSLSSMESIEVSKTISADVDANAPAGTINLRTKRAFDREGRRITVQANATAFGREFSLDRTYGLDEGRSRKILGGGIFEYSDVFLGKRLGVVLNVSESNLYTVLTQGTVNYNTTTSAADARSIVPTSFSFQRGPHTNRRSAISISTDYRMTPNLTISLGYLHSDFGIWFRPRTATFTANNRASVLGDNPMLGFSTSTGGASASTTTTAINKIGKGTTYSPRFEYKRGDLTIDGRFTASDSLSVYAPNDRGSIFGDGGPRANAITFSASRSSPLNVDWKILQTAGPDVANGSSYTTPTLTMDDGRMNRVNILVADVSTSLKTRILGVPVIWKAGVKKARDSREFELRREASMYDYTGPGAGIGGWATYRSPYNNDIGVLNTSIQTPSGGAVPFVNPEALYALFREHPEFFAQSMSTTNYFNAFISNKKKYVEDIDAAFAMGTVGIGKKLTMRGGLRWEKTSGDSLEFDPLPPAEVRRAGFSVASGRATTIPGIEYQYFSRPRVHRLGGYDNFFPSASLKYRPTRNLDLQLGYSSTIRRPTFANIAGVWIINDENLTVTAPNAQLQPEKSNNLSLRAATYFEPVGMFAISLFQNNVRRRIRTNTLTAEEFGYSGEQDLSAYRFITTFNSQNEVRVRGMELEFSQNLSFLPAPFNGLDARASYTRNYADVLLTGTAGHALGGGVGFSFRRVKLNASANWHGNRPTNITNTTYIRHRVNVDVGGSLRISARYSFFISVRNILDEPQRTMQVFPQGLSAVTQYEVFGTNYTFGIKGVF